jgi:hypothetical protein
MNDRQTHIDLLAQVADSTEERDNVRRILGGMTEDDLDAQERFKRAPFPIGAANHAHRYSACQSGPCAGGTKLCPTPAACQCAEGRPATERGDIYRVLAMATWPLYFVAIGAFFAWLLS